MKNKIVLAMLLGLAGTAQAVEAADISAGMQASKSCVSCHGANGISANENYPNLAGQKSAYLEKQMKDFKDKKRVDPIMNSMSASLSDQQIANIAAYYASLK